MDKQESSDFKEIEFPIDIDTEELALDIPQRDSSKALLFGIDTGAFDSERSIQELAALAEANNLEPVAEVLQNRNRPDPATAMGAGKLEEAKLIAANLGASIAIYDGELTGSQIRNLERRLDIPVIDRTMLILEIFAGRATSREGKTQTELATLEYRLPRLSGIGQSLSQQAGGGAGGGGARRGGGETKLEYDRRYIRSRISILKRRLAEMQKNRDENRRDRRKSGVPVVAMVGYTNVGKSSLVNALAGSDIKAENMLFATLDPTARRFELPDGQSIVLVDTVGFVSRLPHGLVEAFKSTLEEVLYCDLIIRVADASDPDASEQLAVTDKVLSELGADAPQITVYNKGDLVSGFVPFDPAALVVSASTGQGLDKLAESISKLLSHRMCSIKVLLPYVELKLADVLRKYGNVKAEDFRENGVYYEATLEISKAYLFEPFLCSSDE